MCQFELCYKLKKTKRGSRREDVTEPKNKWTYGLFARVLRIFLCLEVFAFVWDKNLYDATQVCYAVDTHCYCSSRLFLRCSQSPASAGHVFAFSFCVKKIRGGEED